MTHGNIFNFKGLSGCGRTLIGAHDTAGKARRTAALDRQGLCNEPDLLSSANWWAMPQKMNDADLNCRLGKDGDDRFREALESIKDGDENVPSGLQLHPPQPEIGVFTPLEPWDKDLLGSVGACA